MRSLHFPDRAGVGAHLDVALEYSVRDFVDTAIADKLAADVREASAVAYRHVFTDELTRQLTEQHSAAFEGALKGIRKRQLMDGEP